MSRYRIEKYDEPLYPGQSLGTYTDFKSAGDALNSHALVYANEGWAITWDTAWTHARDGWAFIAYNNPNITDDFESYVHGGPDNGIKFVIEVDARGGAREGAGRKSNAEKSLPVRSEVLSVRLAPEYAAWVEQQVAEGRFRSVSAYIESLINGDLIHRQLP